VAGDATEFAAMPLAMWPAGEKDRFPSLTTTSSVSMEKLTSLAVWFTMLRVWVVLWPGLHRTVMTAGDREMEARDNPPSPAGGADGSVDGVWAPAMKQKAAQRANLSFALTKLIGNLY
jgi:hypothetical protein